MAFDNSTIELEEIEELEHKYLMKYWYFLKFIEDEMVKGIHSMEDIRDDWDGLYGGTKKSEYDVGCERVVRAFINGKMIGNVNSCPVSSDIFFETEDAFIHIDLKSVTTKEGTEGSDKDNITDFNTSIFLGPNQNSYNGNFLVNEGRSNQETREYIPNLPVFYEKKNGEKKITLTYLVCFLNSSVTRTCQLISIMCVPNGMLYDVYGTKALKAGKTIGEIRYNFKNAGTFELLEDDKKRVRIVYKNPDMSDWVESKLELYLNEFDPYVEE